MYVDVFKLDEQKIEEIGNDLKILYNNASSCDVSLNDSLDRLVRSSQGVNAQPSGFLNLAEMVGGLRVDVAFLIGKIEQAGDNLINAADAIRNMDRENAELFLKSAYRADSLEFVSKKDNWLRQGVDLYNTVIMGMSVAEDYSKVSSSNSAFLKGFGHTLNILFQGDLENGSQMANTLSISYPTISKTLDGLGIFLGPIVSTIKAKDWYEQQSNIWKEFWKTEDSSDFFGESIENLFDNALPSLFAANSAVIGASGFLGVTVAPVLIVVGTIAGVYSLLDLGIQAFTDKSIGNHIGEGIKKGLDTSEVGSNASISAVENWWKWVNA